jgi:hypothetical protein
MPFNKSNAQVDAILDDLEAEREGIAPVEDAHLNTFVSLWQEDDRDARLMREERPPVQEESLLDTLIKAAMFR